MDCLPGMLPIDRLRCAHTSRATNVSNSPSGRSPRATRPTVATTGELTCLRLTEGQLQRIGDEQVGEPGQPAGCVTQQNAPLCGLRPIQSKAFGSREYALETRCHRGQFRPPAHPSDTDKLWNGHCGRPIGRLDVPVILTFQGCGYTLGQRENDALQESLALAEAGNRLRSAGARRVVSGGGSPRAIDRVDCGVRSEVRGGDERDSFT